MNFRQCIGVLCLFCATQAAAQNFWAPDPLPAAQARTINALAVGTNGHLFAATNGSGLFRSTDDGASWSRIDDAGMKSWFYSVAANGSTLFAGSYLGLLYRSTDEGETWLADTLGGARSIVTGIAVVNATTVLAGTGVDGLWRSNDGGVSWRRVTTFPSQANIFPITVDNHNRVCVGTYGSGVFRSTDGGNSWLFDGLKGLRVNGFAPNPQGGLFAVTDRGIWKDTLVAVERTNFPGSFDTTHLWKSVLDTVLTPMDELIAMSYFSAVVGTPAGHLLAATAGSGMFHSTDLGKSWEQVNGGLASADIRALAVNAAGYVWCGTVTGLVYKSAQAEPTAPLPGAPRMIPGRAPVEWVLGQNYPNPFNPRTIVPFEMPVGGRVSLTIYNAIGERVALLVDADLPAGRHAYPWDASGMPSGIYFYRLQSASFSRSGKLTLMK